VLKLPHFRGENEKLKSEAAQRDSELALLRKECGRLSEELAKLKWVSL